MGTTQSTSSAKEETTNEGSSVDGPVLRTKHNGHVTSQEPEEKVAQSHLSISKALLAKACLKI